MCVQFHKGFVVAVLLISVVATPLPFLAVDDAMRSDTARWSSGDEAIADTNNFFEESFSQQ